MVNPADEKLIRRPFLSSADDSLLLLLVLVLVSVIVNFELILLFVLLRVCVVNNLGFTFGTCALSVFSIFSIPHLFVIYRREVQAQTLLSTY